MQSVTTTKCIFYISNAIRDVNSSYIIVDKYKTNKNNYNNLTDDYKKLEYLYKRITYINNKLLEKVETSDIENILTKIEKIV